MRDDVMLLALPEVHADITNTWQDGSRLTFFSKYGNGGCRVIGIGCMSKMAVV